MITLLTDFGYSDYFVPVMKGIIKSMVPSAEIIDITHDVPPQNVRRAAFVLWKSYKYFPRGTIHVAVVDPGVGTRRRALVLRTSNYFFVGPDNGVLSLAAFEDGIVEAVSITSVTPRSTTFHGRDIFAPIAAELLRGASPSDFGERVDASTLTRLQVPRPLRRGDTLHLEAIYIDRFGNVFTSATEGDVDPAHIGDLFLVSVGAVNLTVRFLRTYGEAGHGEPIMLINSEGYLELAVNGGNMAAAYGISEGDKIVVRRLGAPPREGPTGNA